VAEFLPLLGEWTPASLLGLVVLLILFGGLVPIRTVRKLIADKDVTIADLREANAVLKRNNAALLRGNLTTAQVLEALPGGIPDGKVD
jgi:hypothetical protein